MTAPKILKDWEAFNLAIKSRRLILYGAGYNTAKFINENNNLTIDYICDNNKSKIGRNLMQIPIVNPSKLKAENSDDIIILITPARYEEILNTEILRNGNFSVFILSELNWDKRIDNDYIDIYNEDYLLTLDLFEDDKSRSIFSEIISKRQKGIMDFSNIFTTEQYYLMEMYDNYRCNDEIIIDAGGYTGDTLHKFIEFFNGTLKRIYIFEPVEECMEIISKVISIYPGYDIISHQCGLSDAHGKADFIIKKNSLMGSYLQQRHPSGDIQRFENMHTYIETESLDEVIPTDEKVTFIKMDIEGAEYKALIGAKGIIQKYKPRLAIAAYHSIHDLIYIPKLIKEMVPEYKLFIRHHGYSWGETVVYAFL